MEVETIDMFAEAPQCSEDAESERRALIALSLIPGVGATRARTLVASLGSATAVREAPAHWIANVRGIGPPLARSIAEFDSAAAVARQLELAERVGARFVKLGDAEYPAALARIYDPPPFLWVRGRMVAADSSSVAVIGTRKATAYGKRAAASFASGLAEGGVTVVSGLAYGIDIAGHQAALDAGGRTIAVLGSGVDRVYPARHAHVVRRIIESGHGAVISEVPMGTDPARGAFPSRNRIIAGMTLGTVVVESGPRGGALLTAAMALDQNREVFAVPAPVFSELQGTNRLIQRGCAGLASSPEDILDVLAPHLETARPRQLESKPALSIEGLTSIERRLLEKLTSSPLSLDVICDATGIDASSALVYLLQLEFRGLVRQLAGKQFFRHDC